MTFTIRSALAYDLALLLFRPLYASGTTGRVGIGTTAPDASLTVIGDISASQSIATGGRLYFSRPGVSSAYIEMTPSSDNSESLAFWTRFGGYTKDLEIKQRQVQLAPGGMGRVAVWNTNPQTAFHVSGTIRIADSGEACDTNRAGAMRYTSASTFDFCNGTSGWRSLAAMAAAAGISVDRIISGTTSVIASQDRSVTVSTNGAERLVVAETGNVGIGTSTPGNRLTVAHGNNQTGMVLTPLSNGYSYIAVSNTGGRAVFGINDNTGATGVFGGLPNSAVFGGNNAVPAQIITNQRPRLTVLSTGNTGVMTDAPSATMHVSGTLMVNNGTLAGLTAPALYADSTNGRVGIGINTPSETFQVSGTSYFTGNAGFGNYPNGTSRVRINSNGFAHDKLLEITGGGIAGGQSGPFYGLYMTPVSNNNSSGNYGIYLNNYGGGGYGPAYGVYANTGTGDSTRRSVGVYGQVNTNSGAVNNHPATTASVAGVMAIASTTGNAYNASTTALIVRNESVYADTSWGAYIDAVAGPKLVIPLQVNYNNSQVMRVTSSGTVVANGFVGDGSGLTGLAGGDRITSGTTSVIASNDRSITFNTAGSQTVVIGENGRVGIGTTAPSTTLHLISNQDNAAIFTGNNAAFIYVQRPGTPATGLRVGMSSANHGVLSTVTAGQPLIIGSGSVERIRVAANGNIGISTTNPSETLTVNGNADVSGTVRVAGTGSEACTPAQRGTIRQNPVTKKLEICRY